MAKKEGQGASLRAMPSIDAILQTKAANMLERELGRERMLAVVRSVSESVRRELGEGGANGSRDSIVARIEERLKVEIAVRNKRRLQRVINATGVVIHTNLGRSPLSLAAIQAIVSEAAGYCNLEYDLTTGERGRRGASAESLLADIVGADDAVIVNNCAAAAFLVLSEFATGGEVIVSRGELVEIGGDFRIPDVLDRSGARLKEVGTTNRTKLSDYERAISDDTKLILRVHPSNFRIIGFTQTPELADLAKLAKQRGLILFEDAGSGALVDLSGIGLAGEPVISDSIKAGADIVSFSGDKLMGGSQAGLIVGRSELIIRLRRNPLYRALRPDKLTYAALEATLYAFATGTAQEVIPVLRTLSMPADEIERRAQGLIEKLTERTVNDLKFEIVPGNSAVGGGAAPNVELPTHLIAATHGSLSAESLAERLRHADPPVITRIVDDRLMIDLRTVSSNDESEVVAAFASVAG
jgi:L-seryl-tRNA(Ser) seleniumtransferase